MDRPEPRILAGRVLAQQIRLLAGQLQTVAALIRSPTQGTPAHDDLNHINSHAQKPDLIGLRWWAHRAATLYISSAHEHERGLALILSGRELLPLPAMTLARSIYEAVLNTCWLIDVEVSTEQRLARWAGQLLYDSQEPPNTLDSFGDAESARHEKERVIEGRGLGQKLMGRAGFDLKLKGAPRTDETAQVTYRNEASSLT